MRWEPARAIAWKVRESGATWGYELQPSAGMRQTLERMKAVVEQ